MLMELSKKVKKLEIIESSVCTPNFSLCFITLSRAILAKPAYINPWVTFGRVTILNKWFHASGGA